MTRAEILDCLTDRPCDSCKFHESGRCERWDCVFEEKPDDCEDTDNYENETADLQNRLDIAEYDNERWKEKVTVLDEKLKALSAEPCEDCISRQAAIDKAVYTETEEGWIGMTVDVKDIESLPPVTPIQKMGHWIHFAWSDDCSECGWSTGKYESPTKFCPNCGAKMQEVDE